MEVPAKSSILHVNNSFDKILKTIIEKRKKNEPATAEIEWISSQLVSENRDFCRNSCNVLIRYGKKFDRGFPLNALLSAYSRLKNDNFDIIADGIFSILLETINDSECTFGIVNKPHPAILFLNDSRMLYMSQKFEELLARSNNKINKFLYPVLLMTFCNNETVFSESKSIWKNLVESGKNQVADEIISLRRVTSPATTMLFNSMAVTKFRESKSIDSMLLLLSSTKYLAKNSFDLTSNLKLMTDNYELFLENPNCSNIVLFLLAEIFQICQANFIPKLSSLLNILIVKSKLGHSIVNCMVLDGLIQALGYPALLLKDMQKIEELVNYIGCDNLLQHTIGSTEKVESPSIQFDENLSNAYDACLLIERNATGSFEHLKSPFWIRNHLVLRGYLHSSEMKNDFKEWSNILCALIDITKSDEILKNSLIMPLLFELSQSNNPHVKISILKGLTQLGPSTEIFSTIKALSMGTIRSMAILLHFEMWKREPRIYPFLHKYLVEKSSKDSEDVYLNVTRASVIKKICDMKPNHGSDLVTLISEILNQSLETKTDEVAAALAIDAITILCQNHIISIMSTWKAISLTTRYEKRPRVIKSLTNFLSSVPQFRRNNLEFEIFNKDIVSRIFYMIQWGDEWSIKCALSAFKSWSYDTLTLDMIPDTYRENIALPEAPSGMEVSILDLEVPGECYVQLLSKINPYALQAAGELISHFMRQEIGEYRSGHYLVKEGQAEPINYKNLPKQSIVKALTHFVIQQATTKKAEKIVDDTILLEALNILSQKYSRPLPPLNWSFLHELVHKSKDIRAKCMGIAAKQAVISGTAKRLIENFLINIDENAHEDIEIALNILADLCNGTSNEILKIFSEKISTCAIDNFGEKIASLLSHEKDVTNRENLAMIVTMAINSSRDHVPCDIIKVIPPSILNMIHLSSASKIKYRCEILKHNCHVENAVGWLNELFLEQFTKNEHRDALSDAFVDLLVHASAFPAKKWINDFIILIQNKTIEREVSEGLKFFLDMFIVAIVCMSGYYAVTNKRDIYGSRYRLFGQSLQLFSSHDINTDITGIFLNLLSMH